MTQIKRIYVQNGEVIQNSNTNIPELVTTNAISDAFCNDQKTVTGDPNTFEKLGGLPVLGNAFKKGMVLVMSLWVSITFFSFQSRVQAHTVCSGRPCRQHALARL